MNYDDEITISAEADQDYELTALTDNGEDFTSEAKSLLLMMLLLYFYIVKVLLSALLLTYNLSCFFFFFFIRKE